MKTKTDASGEPPLEAQVLRSGWCVASECESRLVAGVSNDPIALAAIGIAVFARMQPPTVIRISPNGDASIVGKPAKAGG